MDVKEIKTIARMLERRDRLKEAQQALKSYGIGTLTFGAPSWEIKDKETLVATKNLLLNWYESEIALIHRDLDRRGITEQ